jgi:2-hydroxy-3-keto-5-methylthiopentenyl-1-phosphate phosphatase
LTTTIVVDYDGTITEEDLLQQVSVVFGDPAVVSEVEGALREGRISLREEITREYRPVRALLDEVQRWVLDRVRIRPGFREFVDLAHDRGWRVVVLSSGFVELIRPTLERAGVDVEILANRVEVEPSGWRVIWREEATCAVCGEECKRGSLPADGEVIYIGDGISDRCAALASDRVFATRGLARYLEDREVEFERFDDFFDVIQALSLRGHDSLGEAETRPAET